MADNNDDHFTPTTAFDMTSPVDDDSVVVSTSSPYAESSDTIGDNVAADTTKLVRKKKDYLRQSSSNSRVSSKASDHERAVLSSSVAADETDTVHNLNASPSSFLTSFKQLVSQVSTTLVRNLQAGENDDVENSLRNDRIAEEEDEMPYPEDDATAVAATVEMTKSEHHLHEPVHLSDDACDSKFGLADDFDEKLAEDLREEIKNERAAQSVVSPYMSILSQIDETSARASNIDNEGESSRPLASVETVPNSEMSFISGERDRQMQETPSQKRAPSLFSFPIVPMVNTSSAVSSRTSLRSNRKRGSNMSAAGGQQQSIDRELQNDENLTAGSNQQKTAEEKRRKSVTLSEADEVRVSDSEASNEGADTATLSVVDENTRRMMETLDMAHIKHDEDEYKWLDEASLALKSSQRREREANKQIALYQENGKNYDDY